MLLSGVSYCHGWARAHTTLAKVSRNFHKLGEFIRPQPHTQPVLVHYEIIGAIQTAYWVINSVKRHKFYVHLSTEISFYGTSSRDPGSASDPAGVLPSID